MADIGVTSVNHDLDTIAPAPLIGVTDETHVVGVVRRGKIGRRHRFGNPTQRRMGER